MRKITARHLLENHTNVKRLRKTDQAFVTVTTIVSLPFDSRYGQQSVAAYPTDGELTL